MKGKSVLDVGCGVGGPMRTIAGSEPTARITGISINRYQVDTCNAYNAKKLLGDRCEAVRGNFLKMPFGDESFDGAYAVEATCHAPELEDVYGEVRDENPSLFVCEGPSRGGGDASLTIPDEPPLRSSACSRAAPSS